MPRSKKRRVSNLEIIVALAVVVFVFSMVGLIGMRPPVAAPAAAPSTAASPEQQPPTPQPTIAHQSAGTALGAGTSSFEVAPQ